MKFVSRKRSSGACFGLRERVEIRRWSRCFSGLSADSWALGEHVWKNWPPAPKPQSLPGGRSWERQQGWEHGAVILQGHSGSARVACWVRRCLVGFKGGDHLCSRKNLGLRVETQ